MGSWEAVLLAWLPDSSPLIQTILPFSGLVIEDQDRDFYWKMMLAAKNKAENTSLEEHWFR